MSTPKTWQTKARGTGARPPGLALLLGALLMLASAALAGEPPAPQPPPTPPRMAGQDGGKVPGGPRDPFANDGIGSDDKGGRITLEVVNPATKELRRHPGERFTIDVKYEGDPTLRVDFTIGHGKDPLGERTSPLFRKEPGHWVFGSKTVTLAGHAPIPPGTYWVLVMAQRFYAPRRETEGFTTQVLAKVLVKLEVIPPEGQGAGAVLDPVTGDGWGRCDGSRWVRVQVVTPPAKELRRHPGERFTMDVRYDGDTTVFMDFTIGHGVFPSLEGTPPQFRKDPGQWAPGSKTLTLAGWAPAQPGTYWVRVSAQIFFAPKNNGGGFSSWECARDLVKLEVVPPDQKSGAQRGGGRTAVIPGQGQTDPERRGEDGEPGQGGGGGRGRDPSRRAIRPAGPAPRALRDTIRSLDEGGKGAAIHVPAGPTRTDTLVPNLAIPAPWKEPGKPPESENSENEVVGPAGILSGDKGTGLGGAALRDAVPPRPAIGVSPQAGGVTIGPGPTGPPGPPARGGSGVVLPAGAGPSGNSDPALVVPPRWTPPVAPPRTGLQPPRPAVAFPSPTTTTRPTALPPSASGATGVGPGPSGGTMGVPVPGSQTLRSTQPPALLLTPAGRVPPGAPGTGLVPGMPAPGPSSEALIQAAPGQPSLQGRAPARGAAGLVEEGGLR